MQLCYGDRNSHCVTSCQQHCAIDEGQIDLQLGIPRLWFRCPTDYVISARIFGKKMVSAVL